MTIQWWRSWHGAPTDHKWAVIAAKSKVKVGIVSAIAWALMDYASQNKDRGSIDGFDIETYAVYSGFDEQEIEAVIMAMETKGIIENNRLVNWEKRQPKREDDSSERVSRHRAKKRNVTQCNADDNEVTPQIKIKDKDKDKDKESSPLSQFDSVQRTLEKLIGMSEGGKKAVDSINEIIEMGATTDDIINGFNWLKDQGKTVRYYSSLVGPTKTAMLKRVQDKPRTLTEEEKYPSAREEQITEIDIQSWLDLELITEEKAQELRREIGVVV